MYFHSFVIISPWKRHGPSFEQTQILFTQGCFVPSLVEIGRVVLEKKRKMWKVYDDNDYATTTTTDNGQIVIRTFGSGELNRCVSACIWN